MKPYKTKPLELGQLLLVPGTHYRVIREFPDIDGTVHPEGESWLYLGYDYFVYDAGYTLFVMFESDKNAPFACRIN